MPTPTKTSAPATPASVRAIRAMYSDTPGVDSIAARTLQGRILAGSEQEFRECVNIIESYNRFNAETVIEAAEEHLFPTLEFREEVSGIYVGREMSPVMYVKTTYSPLGTSIEDVVDAAYAFGEDALADEVSSEYRVTEWPNRDHGDLSVPDAPAEVRLWWD